MRYALFAAALFLPFASGFFLLARPFKNETLRGRFLITVSCTVSALLLLYLMGPAVSQPFVLLSMGNHLSVAFHMDGLSRIFAGIIALLWPLAVLYSTEYMKGERNQNTFFSFYLMTYGVVIGIAFASNLFTLYLFYELLTLTTLPLVMSTMTGQAKHAGKKYLTYSMSGAAAVFVGLALLLQYGDLTFAFGGCISYSAADAPILRYIFLGSFFGFGVKAALWPVHGWLPTAGVAPTPVTALLHAVAVVNSGVFAILRLTYYCIGTAPLSGTWVQQTVLAFSVFTILFGSAMALRYQHLKRRLAYSTISNLSYMLFGAMLMSPAGMAGALLHMIVHSVLKIVLFFCAGTLLCQTHHKGEYLFQFGGFGRKMPFTFAAFTIASLGLIGVPPFPGYISKWAIALAAVQDGSPLALAGAAALCLSAFLTGLYLFGVLTPAYFPGENDLARAIDTAGDPGWKMKTSLAVLTAFGLLLMAAAASLNDLTALVSGGLL